MAFMITEYQRTFLFLKRLRRPVLLMFVVFIISAATTHLTVSAQYRTDPAKRDQQITQLTELIDEKDLVDENGQISALGLFCNNFIASGTAVVLGVVPFIFLPLAIPVINASLLGLVSAIMATSEVGGFYELAVSIAPHGVFEIPALLISAAMGLTLCMDISARILRRRRDMPFLMLLAELARLAVLVVVPLLAVAAVLEAYLTPALMALLL